MLELSRPVNAESIEDFPANQRFIKIPIQRYLTEIGAFETLNRPQLAVINAVNDPKYRFVCCALARRLGKTFIANVIAQLVLLVPGTNILIISPNYNLSSISFELQRGFIKKFGLEVARDNLKDKIIELENGSSIRMGSISTVDSCVGRSYNLIVFDEAALAKGGEEAFNVALRPTLDRPGSKAIFISTPRGRNNWFSEFFSRGFSQEFPEWVSIQADYHENPRMLESDVMEAKRSMSSAEFEQEYLASFAQFEGQIFKFPASNIVDNCEIGDMFAGCDPGYRDPTALVIVSYVGGRYYVVDEYLKAEATTDLHASVFSEMLGRWDVSDVFIDSAAAQFASDLAYIYDIATIKARKDVLPGIAFLQAVVERGDLYVARHCSHTLAALDQYRWEADGREKPVHDKYSHIMDALRYAVYSFVT